MHRVTRLFVLALLATMIAVILAMWWRQDRTSELQAMKVVFEQSTPVAADRLRTCLAETGITGDDRGRFWSPIKGLNDTLRAHDVARDIIIDVAERDTHRVVRLFTRAGRPPQSWERTAIERCAAP